MEQQENELEQARREIDAVDAEMAALFCRRMDAVRRVAAYKQARGLPVLDASREEAVVAKNCARLPDEAYAEYYEDFIRHTMGLSRAFQRAVLGMGTVAYQGVEGAFSHIALTRLFQHVRAQAYPTWAEVFDAVAGGDAAYGVLPFENSHAGDVSEVLDLCYAHRDICVCDVYDLPVSQNLLGVPGAHLSDVKKAVSHPQALQQSAKFIRSLGLETQAFQNTAAAAKSVAEAGDKSVAAIASLETAALYGLSVLAENINTSGQPVQPVVHRGPPGGPAGPCDAAHRCDGLQSGVHQEPSHAQCAVGILFLCGGRGRPFGGKIERAAGHAVRRVQDRACAWRI